MSRADSPLSDRMIFILGAPRSGTHWIQRIIAAHPDAAAVPGETFLFSDRGLGPLFDRFHHGALSSPRVGQVFVDREVLLDFARDFCDRVFSVHRPPDARFLVERTPLFVDHVTLLSEVYPDARVAHIIRDGRDVARSMLAHAWGPSSAADAATMWRDAVSWGRKGTALGRYVEVRYEQLLTAPDEGVLSVFEGLGLDPTPESLERARAEARHHLNIDPTSPRVAEQKWRQALSSAEVRAFEAVAGDLLVELGYEREARPLPAGPYAVTRRGVRMRDRITRRISSPRRRQAAASGAEGRPRRAGALLDALLGFVHGGRADRLPELLEPDVAVRIVSGDRRLELYGDAGRDALVRALRDDQAMRSRQIMGDVVPSGPDVTSVLTYELDDGSRADRVLVVAASGSRVSRISLYQLPSRPPTRRLPAD